MKARKKSGTIEVIQLIEGNKLPPSTFVENGEAYVYNALHDSNIAVKIGDYVRVDLKNDIYPIDYAYFKENFDIVED